jgi:sterol desaturase/sphingolipid hydroxylase (fatty acid hydroxylase superfamily)
MNEILEQYKQDDLIYWFLPIFLLAFALELYYARRKQLDLYQRDDTAASLWMMVYVIFADLLPKFGAFYVFFYLHELSPFKDVVGRQWWAWCLLFFLDDFLYYCMHRANHEVRWFWAGHVNHHSAIKMNYATALRQGVGERFHKYLFWLPLPLLGFDALMVFTMMSISLFYQFWLHTELVDRLPAPIEFIFNTPSHHRVHHASNLRYLDCNHGGTLIIWDRLLGTFSQEVPGEPPTYGLTHNLESQRPLHVLLHEYRAIFRDVMRAESWRDKFAYLVNAPGWSHDGPDKRARTLRRELAEKKALA